MKGTKMNKKLRSEVQKPENWDFETPIVRKSSKPTRIVVSVAFRLDDFQQVSKCAHLVGEKTSQFIRDAAIEKSKAKNSVIFVYGSGSLGTQWSDEQISAITRVSGRQVSNSENLVAVTHG
jgi:hypothetical protein